MGHELEIYHHSFSLEFDRILKFFIWNLIIVAKLLINDAFRQNNVYKPSRKVIVLDIR